MLVMGDALDLVELQKTLYKVTSLIAGYDLEDSDIFLLFSHFSQKAEGAWLAGCPQRNAVYGKAEVHYHCFETSAKELLVLSSLLRVLADFVIITELDEVNIYLLEHLAKKALSITDHQEAGLIREGIHKSMKSSGIKRFIQHFRCYRNDAKLQSEGTSLQTIGEYLFPVVDGLFVRI